MKIKTLQEFANEVLANKNNPRILADLGVELAGKYAFLSDIFKDLQLEKAVYWGIKFQGDKPLSDIYIKTKWRLTEGGGKEIKLKYEIKAIEKLLSAIKSSIVVASNESRNLM